MHSTIKQNKTKTYQDQLREIFMYVVLTLFNTLQRYAKFYH